MFHIRVTIGASILICLLLLLHISEVRGAESEVRGAESNNCTVDIPFDPDGMESAVFNWVFWISRGVCVRRVSSGNCYASLQAVLEQLIALRQAEYSGATTLLTLLPTVGVLLGAPTTEIWMMLMIVPFGGWLTMLVSFGGSMMPTRIEDYATASGGRTVVIRDGTTGLSEVDFATKRQEIEDTIRRRLSVVNPQSIPKVGIASGLGAVVLLWTGAQAAMAIIEAGAVLQFVCTSVWWFHLWYILGQSY